MPKDELIAAKYAESLILIAEKYVKSLIVSCKVCRKFREIEIARMFPGMAEISAPPSRP